MNLTQEQENIVNFAQIGSSFKVFAYAGSGKTSTMIQACKQATKRESKYNRYTQGLFLAFNNTIAKDAAKKLKKNSIKTTAKTWHSLAISNIRPLYGHKMELKKADQILRQYLYKSFFISDQRIAVKENIIKIRDPSKTPIIQFRNVSSRVCKGYIIKAINCYFSSADDELTLDHFIPVCPNWADLDFFLHTFVANNILSISKQLVENIFNTEMSQFPVSFSSALKIYQLSKPKLHIDYDFVIVDEAQDTDLVALDILNNQDLSKIQLIVVGDSFQQIYSWRGALDALNNVKVADTFYLSKSFRFGRDIAKLSTAILKYSFSDFQLPITGNLEKNSKIYEAQDCAYSKYDAIITRTNAGAFDAFMKAIEQNPQLSINVEIDIQQIQNYILDFEKLEKGIKLSSDSALILFENIEQLEEYVEENPTDSDVSSPFRLIVKMGINELKEKIQIITNAVNNSKDQTQFDLTITTAHKSKGLEFDHIILFEDFNPFLFQKMDPTESSSPLIYAPVSEEEVRLFYVAVTRAIGSVTLENFSLKFVESLVRKTLNTFNFSIENTQQKLSMQNDIKLCHAILLKYLPEANATHLENLLQKKNIFEILDEHINLCSQKKLSN
ncbi:AAA family ATPase [Acinetobacter dispersus]|uniref:UvrD-helicase domain-containing protein n=1 Tax=Acinetobacter dispersus TaxID=70348 RepID=UPI001F4A4ACF|nr:UvrD-helicase domain-containing protein [Acinetobacter dispersus]MCH7392723.1 AAA family ATPase [Acinetobacter dispersus]